MTPLLDGERRVLGHLPVWRSPDDAAAAAAEETAVGGRSIVAYTAAELAVRLAKDSVQIASGAPVVMDDLNELLKDLEAKGYASYSELGWQMTEAGLTALHAPPENTPPDHDLNRIKSMVDISVRLVAAGLEAGTHEFNKAGGLDLDGFKAWRAACADETGTGAGELDALEQQAPPIPPLPPADGAPADAQGAGETAQPAAPAPEAPNA